VKRLFDLVKCPNEQLRVAFYYAMRDTVVAEDLEQASRIAYGQDRRWRRVVTVKVGGWLGGRLRVGGWLRVAGGGRGGLPLPASLACLPGILLPITSAPHCAPPACLGAG
jgi:chromosome segregation ATPase